MVDLQVETTAVSAHCLHVSEQCNSWNVPLDAGLILGREGCCSLQRCKLISQNGTSGGAQCSGDIDRGGLLVQILERHTQFLSDSYQNLALAETHYMHGKQWGRWGSSSTADGNRRGIDLEWSLKERLEFNVIAVCIYVSFSLSTGSSVASSGSRLIWKSLVTAPWILW